MTIAQRQTRFDSACDDVQCVREILRRNRASAASILSFERTDWVRPRPATIPDKSRQRNAPVHGANAKHEHSGRPQGRDEQTDAQKVEVARRSIDKSAWFNLHLERQFRRSAIVDVSRCAISFSAFSMDCLRRLLAPTLRSQLWQLPLRPRRRCSRRFRSIALRPGQRVALKQSVKKARRMHASNGQQRYPTLP